MKDFFLRISSIIWLEEITDKLSWKHKVIPKDVREVLIGEPRFRFVEKGNRKAEDVYVALGRTNAGRYLAVFFIYKTNGAAIIISTRDMSDKERKIYGKK
jgi:uncharacterized DUF497 family protein